MNLGLSEEQELFRDTFARLFAAESSPERVRAAEPSGFDAALWKTLADADALGLRVPEAHGGSGAGLFEAVLLAEQAGRHLASAPLIEGLVATAALARADAPLAHELLGRALTGRRGGHDRPAGASPTVRRNSSRAGAVADAVVGLDGDALVLVTRGDESTADAREPGRQPRSGGGRCRRRRRGGERVVLATGDDARRQLRDRARGVAAAHGGRALRARAARARHRGRVRERADPVRPSHRRVPGHRAPARQRRHRRRRRAPARVVRGLVDRAGRRRRRRARSRSRSAGPRTRRRVPSPTRCTRTAATASRSSTTSSCTTGARRRGPSWPATRATPSSSAPSGAGTAPASRSPRSASSSSTSGTATPRRCGRWSAASSTSTSRPRSASTCTSAGTATTGGSTASSPRPASSSPPGRRSTAVRAGGRGRSRSSARSSSAPASRATRSAPRS